MSNIYLWKRPDIGPEPKCPRDLIRIGYSGPPWTPEQRSRYKAYQEEREAYIKKQSKMAPLWAVLLLPLIIAGGVFVTSQLVAGGLSATTNYSTSIDSY